MTLGKSKIFLLCCLSFIIGVAVHSFNENWSEYELIWFFSAVLSLLAVVIFWRNFQARVIFLMILFLFAGIWRYSLTVFDPSPRDPSFYNGREVKIKGVVCNEPEADADSEKFQICVKTLNLKPADGKILAVAGKYPGHNYGDLIMLIGRLRKPEPFQGFAYDKYLAKQGIYSVSYYPEIKTLSTDLGSREWPKILYGRILEFKKETRAKINKGLERGEAILANAMLLGDKGSIPDDIREQFSRAGLSHIIAISGLHIGILVVLIFYLLLMIGFYRHQAFYAGSLALLFYIILIGGPISAVRAGLMGFLALLAVRLGRLPKAENFLIISAFTILLINPMLFRYDIGFQLSFLAVGSILFFYPAVRSIIFEKLGGDKTARPPQAVMEIIVLTFVIQLFITPIVAYNFGIISFVAPLANLLVLWTLPFVIVLSALGILASAVLPAVFAFFPAKLFLGYILWVGKITNDLPFAFLKVEDPHIYWIIIYYVILSAISLGLRYKFIGER
ncbi:MAG: ComEC/Rec2 family competence protein [Patescibacteria group bacterium]